MNRCLSVLVSLLLSLSLFSQQTKPRLNGWHLLDMSKDGYMGISLNQAYELLKGRKSTTVIVAVIDSGIDTTQEDLKPVLWTNEKEISGNGKDDDGNGYIDDMHGWNFDGSRSGENLVRNSHEVERVYHQWKKEFEGKKEKDIPADQKYLYSQWVKAASIINQDYDEAKRSLPNYKNFLESLQASAKVLCAALGTHDFSEPQLRPLLQNNNDMIAKSAAFWNDIYTRANDTVTKNTAVIQEVTDYRNGLENKLKLKNEAPEDWRRELVKDNYLDINDRYYGNNNLKMGSGDHGTLVSGVIGAVRQNGIGIDGIADNVRIMAVRAVPGGDEHDKDVALAI
ncbi:MAG: S8 family serine peptidase, partial [Flavisolibacter sp.]